MAEREQELRAELGLDGTRCWTPAPPAERPARRRVPSYLGGPGLS